MNLESFVKETLVQVSNGVKEANESVKGEDGDAQNTFVLLGGRTKQDAGYGVDFDVAVTLKSEGGGKAKAKLRLAVVDASMGGGGGHTKESVSRVKFTVMLLKRVG